MSEGCVRFGQVCYTLRYMVRVFPIFSRVFSLEYIFPRGIPGAHIDRQLWTFITTWLVTRRSFFGNWCHIADCALLATHNIYRDHYRQYPCSISMDLQRSRLLKFRYVLSNYCEFPLWWTFLQFEYFLKSYAINQDSWKEQYQLH